MEIAAVDERHLDRRTPQLRHRLQTAETSADDDNVVAPGPRGGHSGHYFKRARAVLRAGAPVASTVFASFPRQAPKSSSPAAPDDDRLLSRL
jgi:hypothetical protein